MEIEEASLEAPKLLVGCKSDLKKELVVEKCAQLIKNSGRFSEEQHQTCSAKEGENITDVFMEIIPTYINRA